MKLLVKTLQKGVSKKKTNLISKMSGGGFFPPLKSLMFDL